MENNIYQAISKRNMTQGDLAKKVGVRREYINRIINKKITPTVPLAMRIAHALELSMENLFIVNE